MASSIKTTACKPQVMKAPFKTNSWATKIKKKKRKWSTKFATEEVKETC